MMINRFYLLAFIIIVILAGCKTARVVQPEPSPVTEVPAEESPNELRGLYVNMSSTDVSDPAMIESNLNLVFKNVSDSNFNMVFIPYRREAGQPIDPLIERSIRNSHRYGLKPSLTIDLLDFLTESPKNDFEAFLIEGEVSSDTVALLIRDLQPGIISEISLGILLSDPVFPYLKSYLKKVIRGITESYDLDGFGYDISPWSSVYSNSDSSQYNNELPDSDVADKAADILEIRMRDLLEDLVVEAMLVKPYLVNSVIYPGNQNHELALGCLADNIVDLISPVYDLNDEGLVDNLSELWNQIDNKSVPEGIFPCFVNADPLEDKPVLEDLITFNREMGSPGICILINISPGIGIENFKIPYKFSDHVNLPENLKKSSAFEAAELKLSHLVNAKDGDPAIHLFAGSRTKMMDSNGNIGLLLTNPDSIEFKIAGRTTLLKTDRWAVPYRYTIYPDSGAVRESVWVEFRRMPSNFTSNPTYHFLCKTEFPAKAWIDNDSVKVYKTGIFFNEIKLKEGSNRIRAEVLTADSLSAFYEMEFIYKEDDKLRPAFPLWIDQGSIKPSMDLELLSEDIVTISFLGSPGQIAYVELFPGGEMIKCSRKDFEYHSQYMAEIHLARLDKDRVYQFILNLETAVDSIENKVYKIPMENTVTVRNLDDYPVVKITSDNTRLTYNLGPIRLGGPIRSELGPGVIMKANGRMGDYYRIRLNEIESSVVKQDQVEELPVEALPPSYFITNMSCGPGLGEDIVSIPYLEPVPYAIYPQPDLNRIVITLYGVKTSSTWISHRKGRKIVDNVTWQQTAPETYQVYVNLNTAKIWGYDLKPDGKQLVLKIKYPPKYGLNKDEPLAGLKVAIEAGHGGESTGAVGLSGLLEKDINLDLALKFGSLCEEMGAEVFQVRETDESIGLIDKRRMALASEADLLISIHANAAGTSRGYLRVPGTSTYYNNPFWAPLAENVYDRLLELGLAEFGVVGSFNYTVIRVSQMPTILVEQAFMTHAEDEEKLADPEFREKMAIKIYDGIIDYLSFMNDDED